MFTNFNESEPFETSFVVLDRRCRFSEGFGNSTSSVYFFPFVFLDFVSRFLKNGFAFSLGTVTVKTLDELLSELSAGYFMVLIFSLNLNLRGAHLFAK